MIRYIINEDTTICIYKVGNKTFVGKAKRNPIDNYDENKGKDIARIRAILKYKKAKLAGVKNEMKLLVEAKNNFYKKAQTAIKLEGKIWDLESELINI